MNQFEFSLIYQRILKQTGLNLSSELKYCNSGVKETVLKFDPVFLLGVFYGL